MNRSFKLNNGTHIPSVGYGTWRTPGGETTVDAVKCALENGYTHIDTASFYKNEESVGRAIRESGKAREDLFVTSKLWNSDRGYDTTLKAFERTLEDLQMDYLDLYLIHWPAAPHQFANWKQINSDTWSAMETLYASGKIRALGLSNFLPHHIQPLLDAAKIMPAVNQIEFHPGQMQQECVDYCREKGILVQAWAPLGAGRMLNNETLKGIAARYDRSVAQLCIRWVLQNGLLPLPKSITPSRIKENIMVFDFQISGDDMATIDAMDYFGGSGHHPDKVAF